MVGEFLAKCLYSKSPELRAAALKKVVMRLPEFETDPGMLEAMAALVAIVQEKLADKDPGVVEEAVKALEAILKAISR